MATNLERIIECQRKLRLTTSEMEILLCLGRGHMVKWIQRPELREPRDIYVAYAELYVENESRKGSKTPLCKKEELNIPSHLLLGYMANYLGLSRNRNLGLGSEDKANWDKGWVMSDDGLPLPGVGK